MSTEHEALRFMVTCPAWEGLYKARCAEQMKYLMARLLEPSQKRKDDEPDDYLRGQIEALKWSITWPEHELREQEVRNQEEEKQRQGLDTYETVAEYGMRTGIDYQEVESG